ncbi:MAG TPA: hypothetical protein VG322_12650 [Candidatus Acidoferrales bacterium]|jgi:hypothetical protein|nr:hypothetical protein [Candidatus Acidoferrales bacterium]
MTLQHVNVKLLLENPAQVDLEPLITIFHEWIQKQVFDEMLLDVADYRHVPGGPGVMVIGLQADYSVDDTDHLLGVRYNRKAGFDGSNADRLAQAARAALTACVKLEQEPRMGGKLKFNGQDIELFINDRLLAPNTDASRAAADAELQAFANKLFSGADYSLEYQMDPRRLFGAAVKCSKKFSSAQLLQHLS